MVRKELNGEKSEEKRWRETVNEGEEEHVLLYWKVN